MSSEISVHHLDNDDIYPLRDVKNHRSSDVPERKEVINTSPQPVSQPVSQPSLPTTIAYQGQPFTIIGQNPILQQPIKLSGGQQIFWSFAESPSVISNISQPTPISSNQNTANQPQVHQAASTPTHFLSREGRTLVYTKDNITTATNNNSIPIIHSSTTSNQQPMTSSSPQQILEYVPSESHQSYGHNQPTQINLSSLRTRVPSDDDSQITVQIPPGHESPISPDLTSGAASGMVSGLTSGLSSVLTSGLVQSSIYSNTSYRRMSDNQSPSVVSNQPDSPETPVRIELSPIGEVIKTEKPISPPVQPIEGPEPISVIVRAGSRSSSLDHENYPVKHENVELYHNSLIDTLINDEFYQGTSNLRFNLPSA